MTEPRIKILPEKKLVGKSMQMSIAENTTSQLWRSFMTQKRAIENTKGTDLYSIQVYKDLHSFENFNPQTKFIKWAAIEVDDFDKTPNGFNSFSINEGLYAVFLHKGTANEFQKTYQFIFGEWLPKSVYELDDRPHFELLGAKYKNNDPSSEEEVWIPIKKR